MPERGTRKWVFTLNNYTEDEITQLHNDFLKYGNKYICGKEIGSNGTPHLQGYVMFNNSRKLDTLKKVNKRIHWEEAMGNVSHNKKYCSKDNNVIFEKDMFEEVKKPLEERVNKLFDFEQISRVKLYEKFCREVDPSMEGYEHLKEYLLNNIDKADRMRYKRE